MRNTGTGFVPATRPAPGTVVSFEMEGDRLYGIVAAEETWLGESGKSRLETYPNRVLVFIYADDSDDDIPITLLNTYLDPDVEDLTVYPNAVVSLRG